MNTEHQESSQEGQPENPAESVVGTAISEEDYRYDPAEDAEWYPPVACTLSEYALMSVGINPHKYIVLPVLIDAEDRMRYAVFPWATVARAIAERDKLLMDGREELASIRHERLRDGVLQVLIPTSETYKEVPGHVQKFLFTALEEFAANQGWGRIADQVRIRRRYASSASAAAALLVEKLMERQGDDQLRRLTVAVEAYRRIYEDGEVPPSATDQVEALIERLWAERCAEPPKSKEVKCIAYMLKTVRGSGPGRRVGARDQRPRRRG